MTPFLRRSLSLTLSAWGLALLTASGCGAPAPAGDRDPEPITVRRGAATAGPRTSPFEPQKESDRNFVTDAGNKLDTGCIYRSSGPIEFDIDVTRYLGPLKADGTLANADELIAAKVLGPTATLSMPGYDVDSGASDPDVQPERDRVWFNGEEIGFLSGVTDTWKMNSFQIDIRKVRFAARAVAGQSPAPASNHVTIDIDVANADQVWCTSIDWGAISFRAASPVILVHGNNSDAAFFDRQGFVVELAAQHLLVDNSISMATDTVANHAWLLNTSIPAIAKRFGATGVHLVAHSKGGLDVRAYLAQYQPSHDKDFKVLSYTTLSTPHNGSALADLLVQRDAAVESLAEREFVGFPLFTETVLNQTPPADIGTTNLTTAFTASLNASTVSAISPDIVFNTVAADADLDSSGTIDRSPDEYRELRDESKELRNLDQVRAGLAMNVMYGILRSTASVGLRIERRSGMLGTTTVAVVTANPTAQPARKRPPGEHPQRPRRGKHRQPRGQHPRVHRIGWPQPLERGQRRRGGHRRALAVRHRAQEWRPAMNAGTESRKGAAMNFASIAAALAVVGLTTTAAAQTASSPGEVRIALTDQRFALDRLAADQPEGSATFLVDDAPTIEVDLAATVDGLVTRIEAPSGAVIDAGHLPAGGDFVAFGGAGAADSPVISPWTGRRSTPSIASRARGPERIGWCSRRRGSRREAAVVTRFGTTSPVVAALFAPAPEVVLGNPVVLTAALFGGGQPVAGATVRVAVNDEAGQFTDVTLRDDGVGSDTAAGDGLYSGDLVPTASGRYAAVATLEGAAGSGRLFARQAATTFQVVRPTGILQGRFGDNGVDDNGDQLIDRVRVTPALDVQEPGLYRLMATLRTASGRTLVRAGEATLPVGLAGIDVDFEADALRALGEDGPYEVAALDLYFIDPNGAGALRADALIGVGLTRALCAPRSAAAGPGPHRSDRSVPLRRRRQRPLRSPAGEPGGRREGSGRLHLGLQAGRREPGGDRFRHRLRQPDRGPQHHRLDFVGSKIGQHGVDGPFLLRDLLVYSQTESLLVTQAGQTPAYAFREFEGASVPDVTPPSVTVTVSPATLTSPNHRLVPVTATVTVNDDQDPNPVVRLVSIVSSDPDKILGCGDLPGDIQGAEIGADDRSFQLRAEHGPLRGRVYTITYEARDASGNSQRATAQVTVPRWR